MEFPETDWKTLRKLHPVALERLCERVLAEAREIVDHESGSAHDRYLQLFQLLKRRDKDVEWAFDDMRRSRALERILAMRKLGLLTEAEISSFSEETRGALDRFVAPE